jgi:alkyldihydroxyacetonephosphate synthase
MVSSGAGVNIDLARALKYHLRMPLFEPVLPDPGLVGKLERICGAGNVSINEPDRIAYSRDMWPRSLIRQRSGILEHPPDLIVWPETVLQVSDVVRLAQKAGLPVVPFGAGSGVCAGTLPVRGGIVLDLKRMNRILELNAEDRLLVVEAGAMGEILERELNRRGFTLGHFPSSMYCSTVGGWIAARGAGQCSSRYGKIEDMVLSVTFIDAEGRRHSTPFSRSGMSAWSIDPLLVGSEGTLGVITSAALVLRELSAERWYRGFRFPNVSSGVESMRLILRHGLRPAVVRLYDEFDTVMAKTGPEDEDVTEPVLSGFSGKVSGPLKRLASLGLRRLLQAPRMLNRVVDMLPGGCLMVVVAEGVKTEREYSSETITTLCRNRGAVDLGAGPGKHWWKHRYGISYKQAPIFTAGAFVDTMEVATTWDRILSLHKAVRKAVSSLAFIMAHFSHAYREGCSIYFTFVAAAKDDAAAATLYDRIWDAAQEAVLSEGAVVSHHHGVGMSKQRFLIRQLAEANVLAQAVKIAFDAGGLFNPGKLGQRGGCI